VRRVNFDLRKWQAMPVIDSEEWCGDGFYRARLPGGDPVVGYCDTASRAGAVFIAHPVVRVPMGRA
jgi:hypothetical protein